MVYFLNDVEQKNLTLNLRPKIRLNPVPEELRGWNWHSAPMKPYYDIKLPMYLICSKYCDSSRDVFLRIVEKEFGEENIQMRIGKAIHEAAEKAVSSAKSLDFDINFELDSVEDSEENEIIKKAVRTVMDYTLSACKTSFLRNKAEQPYANISDIILTSIPYLVEHRMSGELLGCSGLIAVDCYDYMRNIIYDIKYSSFNDFYRLYTTGYALVLESLYEIPVDVGCTIYVNFKNDRLVLKKDLHYIDSNLRSWWVEERDMKAEIVYNEVDPGKAENCPNNCMFKKACG